MFNHSARKNKKKLTTAQVYGELPIWKVMLRIAFPSFVTSFMSALFTFLDLVFLVNLMPLTHMFDFYHLFLENSDLFNNLINHITIPEVREYILHNSDAIEQFIHYIANTDHLHFYDTAATVRVASSLVSPLTFIITAITGLILPGGNVLFAQALSKQNFLNEVKVWQNEFYCSVIVTIGGMLLIYILNYSMIPATVNGSIDMNITPSEVHNSLGTYYYTLKNNQITFYTITNHQFYVYDNPVNPVNVKPLTFDINNNNQIIATTFLKYYGVVKNYSVTWAQNFISIMTCGLWISTIVRLLTNTIRAHGRTLVITIILLLDTLLNMVLDFCLIYFAQIGMDGAAVATIISWIACTIPLLTYFHMLRKEGLIYISFWHLLAQKVMFNWRIINQMSLISISYLISIIGFMVVRVLLIHQIALVTAILYPALGSLYFISITGAIYPIMNLFQNTISGFMNAGTSIVSYNFGIKRYDRLRIIVFEITIFILVVGGTILGLFGFCTPLSNAVLYLFNVHYVAGNNSLAYLYECSRKFLWISLMILPFQGLGNSAFMLFRSSKRYLAATGAGVLRSMLIIIPYLFIFSAVAENKLMPIPHPEQAQYNPLYNPNMWIVLWTQSASTITSNIITLTWTIAFIYTKVDKPKVPWYDWKLIKVIRKKYMKNLMNESNLKTIDKILK